MAGIDKHGLVGVARPHQNENVALEAVWVSKNTMASEACPERQQLAKDLLAMSEPDLDVTTSKIRDLFKESFVSVAATGILNGTVENVLRLLATMLKSDVHVVERTNGIIKREVRRSPHMALPLLSARVQLKTATGGNSQQTKWSQLHAGIEKWLRSVSTDICKPRWSAGPSDLPQ